LGGATDQAKQAERAEQYRSPAKELFDGYATISRNADEGVLRGLGNKLRAALALGHIQARLG
ncbi:MAG: hypothetical protein IPQ07_28180, partial [Myxococcales bacterium]|nr:hypothetical protein [Myxococcales bacterium]